jgi:hypothetical protein
VYTGSIPDAVASASTRKGKSVASPVDYSLAWIGEVVVCVDFCLHIRQFEGLHC